MKQGHAASAVGKERKGKEGIWESGEEEKREE